MQILKYIFFFSLISFTFQLDHCIQSAKICKSQIPPKPTSSNSIANCLIYNDEDSSICDFCDLGYAISYEIDKCISFPFCYLLKEGNKECAACYEGYYLKNNACTKIPINNCQRSDDGEICTYCQYYSKRNSDGTKCDLANVIEGCDYNRYDDDGYCTECMHEYEQSGSGRDLSCTFTSCDAGDQAVEYCQICEDGYYNDDVFFGLGNCKPYETGNSNNSRRNEIRSGFILLLLTLLI